MVGAFFAESKKKAREKERQRRWDLVQRWLGGDGEAEIELRAMQEEIRERLPVFHWMLEFPEVFWGGRADPLAGWETDGEAYFDACVGNPPFMGGRNISSTYGDGFSLWLEANHEGGRAADLSAHFFLRAKHLLGHHGTLGYIATKTISQGDTRAAGLQRLARERFVLYDATPELKWPGQAGVVVAVVHAARGMPARGLPLRLNGGTRPRNQLTTPPDTRASRSREVG